MISKNLADVTERAMVGLLGAVRGRVQEREAGVPGGQLIGLVDAAIAAATESCVVRCTEHSCGCRVAHIALDLHLLAGTPAVTLLWLRSRRHKTKTRRQVLGDVGNVKCKYAHFFLLLQIKQHNEYRNLSLRVTGKIHYLVDWKVFL